MGNAGREGRKRGGPRRRLAQASAALGENFVRRVISEMKKPVFEPEQVKKAMQTAKAQSPELAERIKRNAIIESVREAGKVQPDFERLERFCKINPDVARGIADFLALRQIGELRGLRPVKDMPLSFVGMVADRINSVTGKPPKMH